MEIALYAYAGGHAKGEIVEKLDSGFNIYEKYKLKELNSKYKETINQERYVLRVPGKTGLVITPADRVYKISEGSL